MKLGEQSFSDTLFDMVGTSEPGPDRFSLEGARHYSFGHGKISVACQECGKRFKSRDPQSCPRCGGSDLDVED